MDRDVCINHLAFLPFPMQTVSSAPNADYVVEGLQTIATSIISRSKTRISVDNPQTYGHSGRTAGGNHRFSITFGNNDAGFNCRNLLLEFDLKCKWFDETLFSSGGGVLAPPDIYPTLTPNFDQSAQSLLRAVRLKLPNGTVIEDFSAYNEFSNIINSHLQSAIKKEFDLTALSAFSKDVDKDNGLNPLLDGKWNKTQSTNSLAHNQTKRIVIPFRHLAWLNKERFIPLFLLRNGIQFEVELEDPNLAFVFDSLSHSCKTPFIPSHEFQHVFGTVGATYLNWTVAPGSIWMNGTALPVAANPAIDTVTTNSWRVPPYWGANYPSGTAPLAIDAQSMLRYKNFLLIRRDFILEHFDRYQRYDATANDENPLSIASRYPLGTVIGIPLLIRRNGVLAYRGFIAYNPVDMNYQRDSPDVNGVFVNFGDVTVNTSVQFFRNTGHSTYDRDIAEVPTEAQYFMTFPIYNWDHFEARGTPPGTNLIPFQAFNDLVDWQLFLNSFDIMQCELALDWDHMFQFNVDSTDALASTVGATNLKDPRAAVMSVYQRFNATPFKWSYEMSNISLLVDWIKPSADISGNFIRSFGNSTGIPYLVPRVHRVMRDLPLGVTGTQQIVLPMSFRSLYLVLLVLKDPYMETYGAGSTIQYLPALSSFQRRGLSEIKFVLGGTQKPEYTLTMDKHSGIEHIPETGNSFGVSASEGLDPSFKRIALSAIRNYALAGNYDQNASTLDRMWTSRTTPAADYLGYSTRNYGLEYSDASNFVVAVSLARKDAGNFLAGTDTSMSGQLTAYLTFGQDDAPTAKGTAYDPGAGLQRPIRAVFYGFAHGVLTLNNQVIAYRN